MWVLLLLLTINTYAALPETITDSGVKEAADYLDLKIIDLNTQMGTSSGNGALKIGYPFGGGFGVVSVGANDLHAFQYTAPMSTTLNKIWVQFGNATAAKSCTFGVYADSPTAVNTPGALLAQTAVYTTTTQTPYHGVAVSLTNSLAVTAGVDYWLAFHCDFGQDMEKTDINVVRCKYRTVTYNSTLPAEFGPPSAASCISIAGY